MKIDFLKNRFWLYQNFKLVTDITSSDDVVNDHEIQNWVQELAKEKSNGGLGIKGLPGNGHLNDVQQVQQIVTSIIYTCSVGYAAANSGQYDEYSFPPNCPLTMHGKPPKDLKEEITEQDLLKCLPDKEATLEIMVVTKILSRKVTNRLGDFEVQYIADPKALPIIERFREDLFKIQYLVKASNARRLPKYRYLNPAQVPNHICI
ncbi:hypothetical protein Btru_044808 [Bulinus truncatus]|nr:hypothetical protein Btru_044808 [Bulinus truncatus]